MTPQSDILWPHSVSSAAESGCERSGMISCSLGKGYADGRVHFIDKVICCLAACKDEMLCTKSTSASQWLNDNTRLHGQWLQSTAAVAQWLRCCATNRKVAGSIPDVVIGIFHSHNPSDRTMALGSTQTLTEMSTRSISWG